MGSSLWGRYRRRWRRVLAPELRTAFAEEAAGAVSMMVESLAAAWDTVWRRWCGTSEALRGILADGGRHCSPRLMATDGRPRSSEKLTGNCGRVGMARWPSRMTAENNRLRERLASFLELAEDTAGDNEWADLRPGARRRTATCGRSRCGAGRSSMSPGSGKKW